ncbi:MAG: UDP-N-acetylmuramoyl-L-alanine--D-glutamate ligase [Candidatus Limnocylindrales bacterium]
MTAALAEPLTLDGLTLDSFAGRPVAVLGFARSGLAAARFLADRGARVTVYDGLSADELEDAIAGLDGRPVRLLLGPVVNPGAALDGQALLVTSPSVSSRYPTTEPRLRAALAAVEAEGRVPVVSEMDLFLRLCPAVTIGVTGTKGKTTTASLIAAVLGAAQAPVLLGGNVGTPLVERLPELTPAHRVVLEISELQLPTLSRGTSVAVYTHVTADHLDRHGSVAAYRAVKGRLAEMTGAHGALVLNAEDPVSRTYGASSAAPVTFYRRDEPARGEVGVRDGWVVAEGVERLALARGGAADTGASGRVLPLAEIRLPGAHSVSNVLAAVAVGLRFGVAHKGIRGAVAAFTGVEHRLETVVEHEHVRYVNDSQGTQPDAVIAALKSFAPPLVLIAGGRSKDLSLEELARVAATRATAIVLIGQSAADYERIFRAAGHGRVERSPSLEAAVARADEIARQELAAAPPSTIATVLLSPAAASFDMFADYAARGRAYRAAVEALVAGRLR